MPSNRSCRPFSLLAGALLLMLASPAFSAPGPFLQPGQRPATVTLKTLDDRDQTFPVPQKWNLVFFWSLFCHTCIEEIPIISEEVGKLQGQSVACLFITLDTAKKKKAVENFLQKRRLELPILLEEIASDSYKAADIWGVKTTPSAFLVAPDGTLAFSREGPFDPEEILSVLRKGLASSSQSTLPPASMADPLVTSPATVSSAAGAPPLPSTASAIASETASGPAAP